MGKAMGLRRPLIDLTHLLTIFSYTRKHLWRARGEKRKTDEEALVFRKILEKYRPLLEHKRVIVFESSTYGFIASDFARSFEFELEQLGWLAYKVLDSTQMLDPSDYYFFDDHLNSQGHRKIAAAIHRAIDFWEAQGLQENSLKR